MSFIGNILGDLTGANQQKHQGDIAAGNATNATNAQNQLIQQDLIPIYNQLLQNYNQNVQPLQGGVSGQFGAELGNLNLGGALGTAQSALGSSQGTDAFTNIGARGIAGQDVGFLTNPDATNLAQVGQTQLGELSNPWGSGTYQQGAKNLDYYNTEAQRGMDPSVMGAAINQFDNSSQRDINSVRNQLGAGTPNIAGTLSDLGEKQFSNRANLESQLAGQNQQFKDNATANAFSTAQGMDANTMALMQQQLGVAGALDQQKAGMLGTANSTAQGLQQTDIGNLLSGLGLDQNTMTQLLQYINAGQGSLTGATTGIQGLANQYGQAAAGAAGNAQNAYNSAAGTNTQFIGALGAALGGA